jgi:hypothetical protein
MNYMFVKKNVALFSLIIFLSIYISIYLFKPDFLFNQDGSIRVFGIGYRNKTILPLWLLSIILGIFSYLFVLYYIIYSKLM